MLNKVTQSYIYPKIVSLFFLALCAIEVQGQDLNNLIELPDCSKIGYIDFSKDKLNDARRPIDYESSGDSLFSLYCYSKRIDNKKLEAESLYRIGEFYLKNKIESFRIGINYVLESERISKEYKLYNTLLDAKSVLSDAFTMNQMFDYAYISAGEIIEIAVKNNDSVRIAEGNMALGRILRERNEFEKSDSVLNLALNHLTNSYYSKRIGAFTYLHLSNLKKLERKYSESIRYANLGLEILDGYHNNDVDRIKAHLALEMISTEIEIGIFDNKEMLSLIEKVMHKSQWFSIQFHHIIGIQFDKKGDFDQALFHFLESIKISEKTGSPLNTLRTTDHLISLLKKQNRLNNTTLYTYEKLSKAQKKLINQHKNNNYFKAMYLSYEKDKKEMENARLKQMNKILAQKNRNNIILTMLSFSLLAFLTLFFLFRQNKKFTSKIQESNISIVNLNTKLTNLNIQYVSKNVELEKSDLAHLELIEKLNRSNENLEHFASIAAHDIQVPIKTIGGYINLIYKYYGNVLEEEHKEWLTYIIADSNRLVKMIENLLAFSTLTLNLQDKEDIDLNRTVEIILQQLVSSINQNEIKVNIPKPLPLINSHSTLIFQLFMNLLNNSIKFSKDNVPNVITIEWKRLKNDFLQFEILDTGLGIPDDVKPSIFKMFSQVHQNNAGNGIGLASCDKIVRFLGGEIYADSIENQWTKMVFTFKIEDEIEKLFYLK